ncbi:hypothetical protein KY362_03340 [Candidatus Woesearchaeota archaeon]|nr:hypothetical protein [Candidatus Woesearchaeota archaeon]
MKKKPYKKDRAKRLLQSKKAQIQETQFNWIFVLIVGALILAFFAFIVIKQKAASEAKFAGKATQMLNTILVGAKVSSGTVQEIDTPDLSIRFTCSDYYIGSASQRLGNRVVFAPEYVEGRKLITWTRDWNVPFKVASFLYITTPGVRYVIVGQDTSPSSFAAWLYDALPGKLTKDLVSLAELHTVVDENDPYVRIIFADFTIEGGDFEVPVNMVEDTKVSGLVIDTRDPMRKRFQFLEKDGAYFNPVPMSPQQYIEDEVMFGAVFSDNVDEFICLMKRAYARLNVVAQIYGMKMSFVSPEQEYSNCEGLYTRDDAAGNVHLAAIVAASATYPPDETDAGILWDSARELEKSNDLAQLRSCPLLY